MTVLDEEHTINRGPLGEGQPKSATAGCLFAAIGGFAHALRACNIEPVWANEKDPYACSTFRHNLPTIRIIEKPIEELSVFDDRLPEVDILTAGFPCQPFSVAGDKLGMQDHRGSLFLDIIRLIGEYGSRKPKAILLENVKHFRRHDDGKTFARITNELQRAGYWFGENNAKVINTLDYTDIPQNRERLFMVALSRDYFNSSFLEFPTPHEARCLRPVDAFLDLQVKAPDWYYFKPGSQYYPLFIEAIKAGGDGIYQLRRNYVRKNMTGTCFTLMASMGDGGHNQPVVADRYGVRKLTPEECARLQGYCDDWFSFPDDISLAQRYKQIGNSVTVPVVTKITRAIKLRLEAVATKR